MRKLLLSLASVALMGAIVAPSVASAAGMSVTIQSMTSVVGTSDNGTPVIRMEGTVPLALNFTVTQPANVTGSVLVSLVDIATQTSFYTAKSLGNGAYSVDLTNFDASDVNARRDGYQKIEFITGANDVIVSRAFVLDFDAPSKPEITTPVIVTPVKKAVVSWVPAYDFSGIKEYVVDVNNGEGGVYTTKLSGTSTTFATENVPFGGTLAISVKAVDNAGRVSAAGTTSVSIERLAAPDAPKGLTGTVTATSTTLRWAASSKAVLYHVYRDGAKIGESSTTTFVNAVNNTTKSYTYTVRAVSTEGLVSADSNTFVTTRVTPPVVNTNTSRPVVNTNTRRPVVTTNRPIVSVNANANTNSNANANENVNVPTNTVTNIPVNVATNTDDNTDTQATAFWAFRILGSWWFWLILLILAILGAVWLYFYSRRQEEEAEESTDDSNEPPMQS